MRHFVAGLLLIAATSAWSQEMAPPQPPSQIATDINQFFPDNTSGFISPAYLRAVLHVMNASAVNDYGNVIAVGGITITGLTGVTQCLQVNSAGVVTGTGTGCGGGGGGGGTVSSVGATFTGGLVSVSGSPIVTSGVLGFTVAGTSGGIPYFNSASSWASSAALAANSLMIGGGPGVAPSTVTTGPNVLLAIANTAGGPNGLARLNPSGLLPASQGGTGIGALGSGVPTALGAAIDSAGGLPLTPASNCDGPTSALTFTPGSPLGCNTLAAISPSATGNIPVYTSNTTIGGSGAFTSPSAGTIELGVLGAVPGAAGFAGSASGATQLQAASAAGGTATLPNNTGTVAETNLAQSWTATQTFQSSGLDLLGSSTGYTAFVSANSSATNYSVTFPAATDTVDLIAQAQTLTNKTISGSSNTLSAIALSSLASEAANTVVGNATAGSAAPTALPVPSCSGASNALIWTSASGFGCNTISASGLTFPVTVTGTTNSGGIPYFSNATTLSASAALAANALVIGGGAGVAPSTTTTASGMLTALGAGFGAANGFVAYGGALGTPTSGTLTNATGLPVGGIASMGAYTIAANNTAGSASPTAVTSSASVLTAIANAVGAANGLAGVSVANSFTGASTHTGQEAFSGTTSNFSATLTNAVEPTTVGGAIASPLNFDISTQSVYFSTSNQTGNWAVNFRTSSGTSVNTALATNQTVTAVVCALQGSTAYYNNLVQIDGVGLVSGTNLFWQGGTAPSSGNASGYDCYTYSILKTGSATYIVLASQTQF